MTVFRISLAVVLAIVFVAITSPTQAADGKAIFLDSKCNTCHSVDSQSISKTNDKMKAPDLSNAGAMVESADWLKKFLTREVKLHDKNHLKKFSGTDEELGALVDWIMSLKTS